MFIPEFCQRCSQKTPSIMSMYNHDWICDECKDEERKRPDYEMAVAQDLFELAGRVEDPRIADSIRKQAQHHLDQYESKQ